MRKLILTILVGCLLTPAFSRAEDADEQEVAQEVGAVLAWRLGPESVEEKCRSADPKGTEIRRKALNTWLQKNAALIKAVDTRVAEVVPLIFPRAPKAHAVPAVQAQVREILLDSIFSEKSPDETAAICKAEANPASPRWNNPGMPHVELSLAALYDWKVRQSAK